MNKQINQEIIECAKKASLDLQVLIQQCKARISERRNNTRDKLKELNTKKQILTSLIEYEQEKMTAINQGIDRVCRTFATMIEVLTNIAQEQRKIVITGVELLNLLKEQQILPLPKEVKVSAQFNLMNKFQVEIVQAMLDQGFEDYGRQTKQVQIVSPEEETEYFDTLMASLKEDGVIL